MEDPQNKVNDTNFDEKQQESDRNERGNRRRGTRFSDADGGGGNVRDRSRERRNCRIYVSNIPYDYRWQELKDLFRRMVGNVEYVELFKDENNQPRGCGIIEFKDPENVQKALETMNRYEIGGREIVVKEDHGEKRDQYGRIVKDGHRPGGVGGVDMMRDHRDKDRSGRNMGFDNGSNDYDAPFETYGLSKSFLDNLGINGPLHYKIFVANLDYKVDKKKLKEVFKLAGKVQNVELAVDKDGNSRGFAVIEYEHPVEAVQAISMFDRQLLFERRMTVRLDRIPDKGENIKLPEGLHGLGMGLGANGEPLRNVARNLANMNQPNMSKSSMSQQLDMTPMQNSSLNQAASILSAVAGQTNPLGNLGGPNLSALSNALDSVKNLSVLSNPLLASNLASNLGGLLGGNAPSGGPEQNPIQPPQPSEPPMQSGFPPNTFNSQPGGFNNPPAGFKTDSSVRSDTSFNSMMDKNNFQSTYGTPSSQMGGRKSDTITIRNIPLSCTWQTLRDKFRDVGEVRFAEIRGNNLGVVRFFKESDAELAIKLMDGSRMEGRTITVSFF